MLLSLRLEGAAAVIGGVLHIEQAVDAARNRATALDEIAAAATTNAHPDRRIAVSRFPNPASIGTPA